MAMNLLRAGQQVVVWNRSTERAQPLGEAGAVIAPDVEGVFARASRVIVMLSDEHVTDRVLGRGTTRFTALVRDHLLVSTGSTSPEYSRGLAQDVEAAGGSYVEAPVSGSRVPAEAGRLVALLGGDAEAVLRARPLLEPMCQEAIHCGPVGSGLLMKLAVNLYLDTMLVGLAEAVHFAHRNELDLQTFQRAIDSGPMASDVTRVKIPKLIDRDFSVQASTADAYANTKLIAAAAERAGAGTPMLTLASRLYGESLDASEDRLDMVSVLLALEARAQATGHRAPSP